MVGFSLFDGQPEWSEVALVLGIAFVVASAVATVAARAVRRLVVLAQGADVADPAAAARRPAIVAWATAFLTTFVLTAVPLVEAVGRNLGMGFSPEAIGRWALASMIRIAVIALVAWLVIRIASTSIRRLERELARHPGADALERLKRAQTLGRLLYGVLIVLVVSMAALMILRELRVDIVPMLTGAGLAGAALAFGAQWLVRDLIAGGFLILEDQVRVGDIAVINGTGGLVEAINLRTIVLRDVEGVVHVFQNGNITSLANRSRDFSYFLLDLSVGFQEDPDRVVAVLRETAASLQADPAFAPNILEPIEVLGVDAFRDGLVTIRSRVKTVPLKQFEIGRELRRRLRTALQREGISLPPPALSTYLDDRAKR